MSTFYIETLGCDKNTADSESYRRKLLKLGLTECQDRELADFLFINTCSFILPAKEESIQSILGLTELKKLNPKAKVIAVGCLIEQHQTEILESIPELDGCLGVYGFSDENEANLLQLLDLEAATVNVNQEIVLEQPVTGYLKIADGCDNTCTYCAIPSIKGSFKSRLPEELLDEARTLAHEGVRELVLVAQDITDYGKDLGLNYDLSHLLEDLVKLPFQWIRLMYVYPSGITGSLIETIQENKKIVPYLDIPMQHCNDTILKRMGRSETHETLVKLLKYIRNEIPEMVFRSTFILGFPGETEEMFEEVCEFVENNRILWAGAFKYSQEDGTPAAEMKDQLPDEVKTDRLERFMSHQESVCATVNEDYIGTCQNCLVEEQVEEGLYLGRTPFQGPEIDGLVYIKSEQPLTLGTFVSVRIESVDVFDLIGGVINEPGN